MKKRTPPRSDPASIQISCGKKRYPHERAAREAKEAQEQYARDRGEELGLRVYACDRPSCGGWHLTSR